MVTTPYHREAEEMEIRFILGDTGGQLCATVFVDAVCRHIHRPLAGNSSTLCGPTNTLGGLHAVKWLLGGGAASNT